MSHAMSEEIIQLDGLVKRFAGMDKPAVAPLNCTIHSGYVTGLVGPDGAGKTTLMRMLAGLLKPDEGTLLFWGSILSRTTASCTACWATCRKNLACMKI
jgi:ABC-type multidrug transport system, ATPase component